MLGQAHCSRRHPIQPAAAVKEWSCVLDLIKVSVIFFWGEGMKKAEVVENQQLPLEKGVQDEDINMISIDFGISIMILIYLKISKLQV